jgi:proteasome lid subunit RPN8/RPN11
MFGWLCRLLGWSKRETPAAPSSPGEPGLLPLERVVLTDGVARTLFDDYAEHRRTERGEEEIGWVLLGLRHGKEAIVMAALPAGADRDAGEAHVQFNSDAQAIASRILRKLDKRLTILGVVHTHPGSMRYPSGGDLHGDRVWVGNLRGGEGVFAIGTADARTHGQTDAGHMQVQGELCFCWYALRAQASRYQPLPVHVANGADLAQSLRPIWDVLEAYAAPLERLCRLFAKLELEAKESEGGPVLSVRLPLPEAGQEVHLLLSAAAARYYWSVQGEVNAVDPKESQLDRAVFLILAELAKEPTVKTDSLSSFA